MADEGAKKEPHDSKFICGVVEGFYGRPWTTEQRSHLFRQLKKLGMNSYLYAPKDDLKHRAEWRILYTEEETKLLSSLIRDAGANGIHFCYALSPGIDIRYSNPKEIEAIKTKLSQVRSLGCSAFALLFDDIEPSMNEEDQKAFSSFATAQASVSNTVYEFLACELFFFCPTEYCESRAAPSLEESGYLNTIGSLLHPNIKILWTGPRVVSRLLTVEHVDRVAAVMRRRPLIWDNLHANDYDPKRIFLGPLTGRPLELKKHISGLLLNPNSKYEANFIPLRTLADWHSPYREKISQCGGPKQVAKNQRMGEKEREIYDPKSSLKDALESWLHHYRHGPGPAIPPTSQMDTQAMEPMMISSAGLKISDESGSNSVNFITAGPVYTNAPMGQTSSMSASSHQSFPVPLERLETWRDGGKPLSEVVLGIPEAPDVIISQAVNSLTNDYSEPMEFTEGTAKDERSGIEDECLADGATDDSMNAGGIDEKKLGLLIDIFYLPFEHGENGIGLLRDFDWLQRNVGFLHGAEERRKEWCARGDIFRGTIEKFTSLYKLVIESPNKSLVQEIFPYIWEAHGLLSVVVAIIDWVEAGNLQAPPSTDQGGSPWWSSDEGRNVEPWALSGGLIADMQRLIANTADMVDVFAVKYSIPLSLTCYKIRPAGVEDLEKRTIYYEFAIPAEKHFIESIVGGRNAEQFFFDRNIAHFLKYGLPPHHFIAEEQLKSGPNHCFSLVVAILDVAAMLEDYRRVHIPRFKEACEQQIRDDASTSEEEKARRVKALHMDVERFPLCQRLPEELCSNYPSMVEFRWRHYTTEAVSVRRLFHTVASALSMNGSKGFFTVIGAENVEKMELLTRLGLNRIECAAFPKYVIMGHAL